MSAVAQVQYTGSESRVLIDVGGITNGDVFDVSEELALSLVGSFPNDYALVPDETVEPDPEPAAPSPKKSTASKVTTDTTTPTDTTSAPAS